MTTLEQMARAHMERREGVLPVGVPRIGGQPMRWEDLPPFAREHEMNAMRAAVAVIRAEVQQMRDAAKEKYLGDDVYDDGSADEAFVGRLFEFLDAALAEEPMP